MKTGLTRYALQIAKNTSALVYSLTVGLSFVAVISYSNPSFAELSAEALATPVGTWKTIDDKTGEAKAIVQISESNGELEGKIIKIFPKPGKPDNPVCEKCDGERKDKPILGMTFLWGLKKKGDEFKDGNILDPENGKIYSSKAHLEEGGKKFVVRGFLGFSLLGRSQTWVRDEQ